MIKKAKLALELLERELELVPSEQLRRIFGGSNGYCLFHAMAYMNGQPGNYSYYFNGYMESYGSSGINYSSTGDVLGVAMSNNQAMAMFSNYGMNVTSLSNGAQLYNYVQSGGSVMVAINRTGPQGQPVTHAVILTSYNSNGSYNAYDPTTQQSYPVFTSEINASMMFAY